MSIQEIEKASADDQELKSVRKALISQNWNDVTNKSYLKGLSFKCSNCKKKKKIKNMHKFGIVRTG